MTLLRKRSCASRVMPFSFAIRSALSPIDSPVDGSAIAGVRGARSFGRTPVSAATRCITVFAFDAVSSASRSCFDRSIGMSDRTSTPPAIITSACPRTIWSAAEVIAWFAEAHARLTLKAGLVGGMPAASATSRPTFGASMLGTTTPYTTSSTSSGSSSARDSSSRTATVPSCVGLMSRNHEPAFANGVRQPSTIATLLPFSAMAASGWDGPEGWGRGWALASSQSEPGTGSGVRKRKR